MSKMITVLDGFSSSDIQKTCLLLAWKARAELSVAEQNPDMILTIRGVHVSNAISALNAAIDLIGPQKKMDRVRMLLLVAHSASEASQAQLNVAANAAFLVTSMPEMAKRAEHALLIFTKATEAARKDAHRALAELCELFPESVPVETHPQIVQENV